MLRQARQTTDHAVGAGLDEHALVGRTRLDFAVIALSASIIMISAPEKAGPPTQH